MMWIPTETGAVNSRYVTQIVRTEDGCVLHMVDGTKVRSTLMFEVTDDGRLRTFEPDDLDDDDADVPF
jgi:hypothetical protein